MAGIPGIPGGFPKPSLSTIAVAVGGSVRISPTGWKSGDALPYGSGGAPIGISGVFGRTGLSVGMVLQGKPYGDNKYGGIRSAAVIDAKAIDTLGAGFRSFEKPLMTALRVVVVPAIKRNFDEQGRPRWQALSKATVYDRLIKGYPRGPILDRSGRLKREAVKLNVWEYKANTLRFRGNYFTQKVPYAQFQQFGARLSTGGVRKTHHLFTEVGAPKGRFIETTKRQITEPKHILPARPFIGLTVDEEAEIFGIFTAYVVEKVNEHWGKV